MLCVIGGAHSAIDWLSGCCYGRLNCSAIGQALYQLLVPAVCQHLCIIIATDMEQGGRWRTVLMLLQTAEEETVVCFSLFFLLMKRLCRVGSGTKQLNASTHACARTHT